MKKVKISFDQAEKAISLSETWFDLGNGVYAAKVDPKETKCFFKSSRAAGRNFIMVDTAAKNITLTDTLKGLDGFNAVDANTVKKAAGLVEAAEKEPKKETAGEIEEAAGELQAEIISLGGYPVAFNGVSITTDKVVKTLTKPAAATTQKRPKSKSRLRLGASRAAIKTLDTQAADFKAFCEKINAGRKVPYSERNCALLFDQSNGKATEVRGFRSWKAAGRVVKKGSKALIIEAPKMIKTTDENGKHKERLICTPVCVFDVSQTEVLKENKGKNV